MNNAVQLEGDLRQLVSEIVEADPQTIDPNAKLVEELGMDSMMALEIIATIEKRYKVKLPEQELQNVTTLANVVDLTRRYVA